MSGLVRGVSGGMGAMEFASLQMAVKWKKISNMLEYKNGNILIGPTMAPAAKDPETRRQWKRFRIVTQLPEKDQRAVIRATNSPAVHTAKNGVRNGRAH